MIASLLVSALLLQAPSGGSVSGVVLNTTTGKPAANVAVTLMRANVVPPSSIDIPFEGARASSGVMIPGEWWNSIASKAASDAVFAAGVSASDIRQILIRPDRAAWIALADPVTTDAQGMFAFKNAPPGSYTLILNGTGFAQQEYKERAGGGPTTIRLAPGQSVNLQLRIAPAGVVSGRTRDEMGQPIPEITVQLFRFTYDASGRRKLQVVASTRTNDRGEYRLYRVQPGRYYLRAGSSYGETYPSSSKLSARAASGVIQDSFATTFYPGVFGIESASVVEVPAGAEVDQIDLSLRRADLRIRGKVFDATTKRPPSELHIELNSESSLGSTEVTAERIDTFSTYNESDGSFELQRVSPGSYAITFGGWEWDSIKGVVGPVVVASSDKDLGELIIGELNTVLVRSRMENGKLTPAGFSWNQVKVHLRHASIDFRPVRTELNLEAPLSENGELRLKRVVPGDYRLSLINLPAGFYLKEARIGESDALKNLIHLGFAETKTLEIVIGATTSRVEGVAVDGQELAVSGAQVVLIPDHRQRTDLFKAATTTSNGRFTFTSVPPGDYKLFGWEMLEPYAYFDPELLRQVEARGVPVRVGEASSHTLRVTLIPEKE